MANDDEHGAPDEIDLSLDDLDAEPLPPVSPAAPATDMLVITGDDLLDVSDEPAPAAYPTAAAPGAYPGVDGAVPPPGMMSKKGMFTGGLVGSLLIQMLIAGALGGLLGWAINEPLTSDSGVSSPAQVFLSSLVFFAIAGGAIGLLLGGVEGVSSLNSRKAVIGGAIGLGIGAVGGGLAGLLGQAAYGILGGTNEVVTILQVFARTVGWTIAGVFIGLGQGVSGRSLKKIINGVIGGALGGFAGGLLFDPLSSVMFALQVGNPGLISRFLALVVIGAASGAAIGLLEELRKEAWVLITGGPLTGKQFILYNAVTTIGSSPKCEIALLKDPYLAPQHCAIEVSGGAYVLRDLGSQTGTAVNGRPVQRHSLRKGDVIQIGQTALEYQDRAVG